MNLYAGIYDYVVFWIILVINVLFWKRRINNKIGCVITLIIFGFVLPLISIGIEIRSYKAYTIDKPFSDSLETAYTLYRFPLYWAVGLIQVLAIGIKNRINKKNS